MAGVLAHFIGNQDQPWAPREAGEDVEQRHAEVELRVIGEHVAAGGLQEMMAPARVRVDRAASSSSSPCGGR